MKTKKFFWIAFIVALAVLALFYFLQYRNEPEVLKIGAILPLSGDNAKYGKSAQKGIELALEELNTKWSMRKIRIIYEDDKGLTREGVNVFQKLIQQNNLPAIIGPLFSSVTLAIAPIAEKNKIVILSPSASAPEITNAGNYIFRNVASDVFEGAVMNDFINNHLSIENIGIIYINNDYGVGIKQVFSSNAKKEGLKIVFEESYSQDSKDFRTILSKIKNSNVDAIYIIGYSELGKLLKQAYELGIKKQFLSTVMFEDPEILNIAGKAAEGVIYSSRTFDVSQPDSIAKIFIDRFKLKYNQEPDIFAALSYDALNILSAVIKKTETSGEEIKNSLLNLSNFLTVTGSITFDKNGDVIQPAVIKIVKDGKFQLLN